MTTHTISRTLNIIILLLIISAISIESVLYWQGQLRPWQPVTKVGRLIYYYSYFTVLSNMLVAISVCYLIIKPGYNQRFFNAIRLNSLISIIITAVIYNLFLRTIHRPPQLILQITNELLHVIVPLFAIMGWFIFGPFPRIDPKAIGLSLLPLLIYGVYIFIRGELTQHYPYPFINITKIGYIKSLENAFMILITFVIIALLLWVIELVRCYQINRKPS